MQAISKTNITAHFLLQAFALNFNIRPGMKKYLRSRFGWIDFSIGFKTEDESVAQCVIFKNGQVTARRGLPRDLDGMMIFQDEDALNNMLTSDSGAVLNMVMMNTIRTEGNSVCVLLFMFLVSLLKGDGKEKRAGGNGHSRNGAKTDSQADIGPESIYATARKERLTAEKEDPGVKYLEEPYLSDYSIADFPRIRGFLDIHFNVKPEICPERAKTVTDWHLENGFEKQKNGEPWTPELRQGLAFKHLMSHRRPIIRKNDLVAGTTTSKEIGVVLYPDSHGTMIWAELLTAPHRELNPYNVSKKTLKTLHHDVFPYWMRRNFKHWVSEKYQYPLCQKLDERFAVYFCWKSVGLSHTIPDFPKILRLGNDGIIDEIRRELDDGTNGSLRKRQTLDGMIACLEGVNAYAENLSAQAAREAEAESDPLRKAELERLSEICANVPRKPAETLDEAVNSLWISWVAIHMENTNTGQSLGRLDQWLQPYFEADMKKLRSMKKKREYVHHALELIGCFFMRCTDHLPLIPDIGNYLFGGSSSDQAITLGGITPDGDDAVNDMTYIFLKVTEILGIRDPNVNARYNPEKNSDTYLKRLCEVNLITSATPSMHNDVAVMKSLTENGFPEDESRDWSAVGCVEPTISGRHMGHTGCTMFNMVAALEMALNNGLHPLMRWNIGPETGRIESGDFATFDDFFNAVKAQLKFLSDNSVAYNNYLGEAHSVMRPTPYLSTVMEGAITSGKDVTRGGAKYNTSGVACIGLADVTDSLMAVKKLVFEQKKMTLLELKDAVNANFENDPVIHAMVLKKVPRFGSGDPEAVEMANEVASFMHDTLGAKTNFRGGKYTTGFWSLANHVAFGTLSGALPSGRLAGKAFTPGLTPEPNASKSLLDNIRDVALLDPVNVNNNMAFNVKVVPAAKDSHSKAVDDIFSYVKTYFDLGGMQMQLNVVTSDTLRDAMENPENYRNLLVRISGYNAYFTTLNRDMQIELIERAEYSV